LLRLFRVLRLLGFLRGLAVAASNGNYGAVHVELFLAVDPGPCKDRIARWQVGRNSEIKDVCAWVQGRAVVLGAVALPGLDDLERLALID
jgi:hypothetical protein